MTGNKVITKLEGIHCCYSISLAAHMKVTIAPRTGSHLEEYGMLGHPYVTKYSLSSSFT